MLLLSILLICSGNSLDASEDKLFRINQFDFGCVVVRNYMNSSVTHLSAQFNPQGIELRVCNKFETEQGPECLCSINTQGS